MVIHTTPEAGIMTVISGSCDEAFRMYNTQLLTRIQFYMMNTQLSLLARLVPSSAKLFGNLDQDKIVVADEI